MFTVYAISSISRNYIYVGLTSNLENRLEYHNRRYERTTRPYRPSRFIYSETFPDRPTARIKEKYLKSGAGKARLKTIE